MSVPDPPHGEPVSIALIRYIIMSKTPSDVQSSLVQLIYERDVYGRAKYGRPLMIDDGRDSVEDARHKFGDMMQYAYKARMNGEDLSEFRDMIGTLLQIVDQV